MPFNYFISMRFLKRHIALTTAILFAALSLITTTGFKDDDPVIAIIVQKLDLWLDRFEPEKVYLQFDKPCYVAGEDLWFKAIVTAGDHRLSAISGTLNIELSDNRDSLIKWIKLPLKDGLTWGDFALPDSLQAGNYRVRAYTNWMRNAGEAYFFEQVIPIGRVSGTHIDAIANLSYKPSGKGQKVSALISFRTNDGIPVSGKEVNYHILLKLGAIVGGKAMTNDKGEVKINFDTESRDVSTGAIMASIHLSPNESVVKTIHIREASGPVDFQLFPEGGYLVSGLLSRVAFKAVGPDGLGREISGKIIDNEQKQIASLTTKSLGMGDFWFIPEAGKTYRAVLTNTGEADQIVNLPAVLKSGYVMHIDDNSGDSMRVNVSTSTSFSSMGQVYVFAQSNGRPRYVVKSNVDGRYLNLSIPKSRFPSGITQITLFSSSGEPLQERIVFIVHKKDILNLQVKVDSVTRVRQKMSIGLDAKDNNGNAINGYFAASVIDESKVPVSKVPEVNILSQFLLTADLRGYIEQPGHYFMNTGKENRADLDLLMLTQGYRRFEWKSLLSQPDMPSAYKAEKFMELSGTVITMSGKPVPKAKVTLFSNSGILFLLDSVADENGHFAFRNLFIRDSAKLVLQAQTPKKTKTS
ncbi:hypothetical protein [Mucilaginibacter sp. KACC 22063]|uniref:hypothetical protein n=1 Tax=Mucilaginibacter sp. KACC 22063 TaxID=3025666 RepID=UPI0023656630|nr:hypothetical protein [Mucilaginibacter sp. KACC 22063]WDF55825.1 hypothetical protein PQ461_01960 [Mucilaginibacter sp. KACC 22063]